VDPLVCRYIQQSCASPVCRIPANCFEYLNLSSAVFGAILWHRYSQTGARKKKEEEKENNNNNMA
jgi:hypothetical protein